MNGTESKNNNPNNANYCHNSEEKLKNKVDGWLICSIILALLIGILGISMLSFSTKIVYLSGENCNMQSRIQDMTNQIQEKDEQITILESEVAKAEQLQNRIDSLEAQKPQKYYTKYNNQYLYYKCASNYKKDDCYFPEKGTIVTIYTTSDGYGLTHIGGWIPMDRLEKY